MTQTDDRASRLAAQLRANLARRKAQARDAATTTGAGTTGAAAPTDPAPDQCASASDPNDVAAPAA